MEEGWKKEGKNDENGDVVFSRKLKNGKKVFRIKVIVDCSAEKLIRAFETSEGSFYFTFILQKLNFKKPANLVLQSHHMSFINFMKQNDRQ